MTAKKESTSKVKSDNASDTVRTSSPYDEVREDVNLSPFSSEEGTGLTRAEKMEQREASMRVAGHLHNVSIPGFTPRWVLKKNVSARKKMGYSIHEDANGAVIGAGRGDDEFVLMKISDEEYAMNLEILSKRKDKHSRLVKSRERDTD